MMAESCSPHGREKQERAREKISFKGPPAVTCSSQASVRPVPKIPSPVGDQASNTEACRGHLIIKSSHLCTILSTETRRQSPRLEFPIRLGMIVHAYNPSTWEAGTEESSLRPAWAISQIPVSKRKCLLVRKLVS
jgi:hypothetical protein